MTPVVLYGAATPDGARLCSGLLHALSKNGGALHVGGDRAGLSAPDGGCDFLVIESDRPMELNIPDGVIIFKSTLDHFANFTGPAIPEGFTAVVESCNAGALTLLRRSGATVITCGMASTDTMSLSSIAEQSGAVSLLREIRTLSGETVEARDIPVSYTPGLSEYGVLAACAVLLLAGRDPEHGYHL